jgi:glycerophosphoryl diester phosphodiesterase
VNRYRLCEKFKIFEQGEGLKVQYLLDIKESDPLICTELKSLMAEFGNEHRCVVMGLHPEIVEESFRLKIHYKSKIAKLYNEFIPDLALPKNLEELASSQIDVITICAAHANEEVVNFAHQNGMEVYCYFYDDYKEGSGEDYPNLVNLNVDCVISDYPLALQAYLL